MAAAAVTEPLDWEAPWPFPWSRLEELAARQGVEVDLLRERLRIEIARRRAGLGAVAVAANETQPRAEPRKVEPGA